MSPSTALSLPASPGLRARRARQRSKAAKAPRKGPAQPKSGAGTRGRGRLLLAVGLAALALAAWWGSRGASSPQAAPARTASIPLLKVEVLASFPHDPGAYTQGLLWNGDVLFESTGLNGRSSLRKVALESGEVLEQRDLPRELFGEGLERVGGQLYQLTWRSGLGQIWDLETFERTGQFFYQGEGWGLCFDGKHLVMSDGSHVLSFRDPSTFAEVSRREVRAAGRRVRSLNELECVDGEIYANVYGSERIARIDAASGEVTAWIDASGLLGPSEQGGVDVLNGIAYRPEAGTFLITGKLWPKVFEVKFVEPVARARQETP